MKELTELFSVCLNRYKNCAPCDSDTCQLGFYCRANNCLQGQCDRCMNHIQWDASPQFHYSCSKITFQYILRFFNRFASEIAYFVASIKSDYLREKIKLNVVSLGCGPGSEVYGFIKALRVIAPHIILDYQGFDLNDVWREAQQISKAVLSKTPHLIEFYLMNMFGGFHGFSEGKVDFLVLNYLLSDSQKYYHSDEDKIKFIDEIAQFVFDHDVKNILFNDQSYYGKGELDSGVGMMLRLIKSLESWDLSIVSDLRYFPSDKYVPSTAWRTYKSDKLIFQPFPGNTFDINISCCRSKQILIHID